MNRDTKRRFALAATSAGFLVGFALFNGGSAQSIGGLCNGQPATHTWLDASGQYGPVLLDGTDGDDIIIGSDGDDHIDAGDGDDIVCGGAGHNDIHGGEGDDVLLGSSDHDHLDGGAGVDTVVGFGGDDTIAGGSGYDVLLGGPGDDVMISTDRSTATAREAMTRVAVRTTVPATTVRVTARAMEKVRLPGRRASWTRSTATTASTSAWSAPATRSEAASTERPTRGRRRNRVLVSAGSRSSHSGGGFPFEALPPREGPHSG
jgi:Ca2+-binding RTX toxin-like protein